MSTKQKKFKLPTQDDILEILQYVVYVLPFPIIAFSLIVLTNGCNPSFLTMFIYFLLSAYHGCKLYIEMCSAVFSSEPIYKRIWLSHDLHVLILVFVANTSGLTSCLFFIDVLIIEGENAIFVVREYLSNRLGDMKDSVVELCDSIFFCEPLYKTAAFMEILMIPYLFFNALFRFEAHIWASLVFYLAGYAAFQLLNSRYHDWAYGYMGKLLEDYSKKNESVNKFVSPILKYAKCIPKYARVIYPVTEFTRIVKK